jgi:hypothetical protein
MVWRFVPEKPRLAGGFARACNGLPITFGHGNTTFGSLTFRVFEDNVA